MVIPEDSGVAAAPASGGAGADSPFVTWYEREKLATRIEKLKAFLAGVKGGGNYWLVRWEATDIYSFILDTENLSIVRGASMILDVYCRHLEDVVGAALANGEACIVYAAAGQANLIVRGDKKDAEAIGVVLRDTLAAEPWSGRSAFAVRELAAPSDGELRPKDGQKISDLIALQPRALALGVDKPKDRRKISDVIAEMEVEISVHRMMQMDADRGTIPPSGGAAPERDRHDLVRVVDAKELGMVETKLGGDDKSAPVQLSKVNARRFRFGQQWRFGLAEQLCDLVVPGGLSNRLEKFPTFTSWAGVAKAYLPETEKPWPTKQKWAQDFVALGEASEFAGYMAVIEGDGNGFGSFRAEFDSFYELGVLSVLMEMATRRTMAQAFKPELQEMIAAEQKKRDPERSFTQKVQLLVFAGDEFTLVAPAHRAFDAPRAFLQGFKKCTEALEGQAPFSGLWPAGTARPKFSEQSFGLGVAVTHANTPIRHVRIAAHELANSAKNNAKLVAKGLQRAQAPPQASSPAQADVAGDEAKVPVEHGIDFAVMKSHDVHPNGVLSQRTALLERVHGGLRRRATRRPMLLDEFVALHDAVRTLRVNDFPRRQLKRAAQVQAAALWSGKDAEVKLSGEARDALRSKRGDEALKALDASGSRVLGWVDAAEMMDVVDGESA